MANYKNYNFKSCLNTKELRAEARRLVRAKVADFLSEAGAPTRVRDIARGLDIPIEIVSAVCAGLAKKGILQREVRRQFDGVSSNHFGGAVSCVRRRAFYWISK